MNRKEWVDIKNREFNKEPNTTLINLLINTTDAIAQYLDNPKLKAPLKILKECLKCNQYFLRRITRIKKYK